MGRSLPVGWFRKKRQDQLYLGAKSLPQWWCPPRGGSPQRDVEMFFFFLGKTPDTWPGCFRVGVCFYSLVRKWTKLCFGCLKICDRGHLFLAGGFLNIFYFFSPKIGEEFPFWPAYFSMGLKPPTSFLFVVVKVGGFFMLDFHWRPWCIFEKGGPP